MRVALYARVSSKVQEKKGTIASQIEALRNHATEHQFEIEESYVCTDDGYSGALLARPELDRLRDGAQADPFDAQLYRRKRSLNREPWRVSTKNGIDSGGLRSVGKGRDRPGEQCNRCRDKHSTASSVSHGAPR